jgi:hypothetical protein
VFVLAMIAGMVVQDIWQKHDHATHATRLAPSIDG